MNASAHVTKVSLPCSHSDAGNFRFNEATSMEQLLIRMELELRALVLKQLWRRSKASASAK